MSESALLSSPKKPTLVPYMNAASMPFVVSLMPFEKQILVNVASADVRIQNILEYQEERNELRVVIGGVFHRWQPYKQ